MPNIKFHYLYRDGGNYKAFGSVVFDNPDGLGLTDVVTRIKEMLIDGEWFYADSFGVADLRPLNGNLDCDPTWHEFIKVEFTEESISNFSGELIRN